MVTLISGRFCFTIALQNCGWGWKPGGEDGQADGLAAEEVAVGLAVELEVADVLALEESANDLLGDVCGVDGKDTEGEEELEEHLGELIIWSSSSSPDSSSSGVS